MIARWQVCRTLSHMGSPLYMNLYYVQVFSNQRNIEEMQVLNISKFKCSNSILVCVAQNAYSTIGGTQKH